MRTRVTRVSFDGPDQLELLAAQDGHPAESYSFGEAAIERTVRLPSGASVTTRVQHPPTDDVQGGEGTEQVAYSAFWSQWLRGEAVEYEPRGVVTTADLFSGCGGLSVGVREACRAIGYGDRSLLSVDNNADAAAVFRENFKPTHDVVASITDIVDGDLGVPLSPTERQLRDSLGDLTFAVGGPPCQGHSDLNNHTRRDDPKNALYLRMGRFVEVAQPSHVIIENVPGVVHARAGVVAIVKSLLDSLGYHVDDGVVAADKLGWPQGRRRHLLVASRSAAPSVAAIAEAYGRPAPSVLWAIEDLADVHSVDAFDTPSRHSLTNQQRIDHLFDNDVYELPDELRPDCHRLKKHTYVSVYGRMRPDEPAPTITSGFGSTGQGRFVHPLRRRTLTPHEAARLQGFPDSFTFDRSIKRSALQQMIGNAVPSRLGYAAAQHLLAGAENR